MHVCPSSGAPGTLHKSVNQLAGPDTDMLASILMAAEEADVAFEIQLDCLRRWYISKECTGLHRAIVDAPCSDWVV
jgi:hypothetical protein